MMFSVASCSKKNHLLATASFRLIRPHTGKFFGITYSAVWELILHVFAIEVGVIVFAIGVKSTDLLVSIFVVATHSLAEASKACLHANS